MKKMLLICAGLSLLICGLANAGDKMVIVFTDGTSQTVNLMNSSANIQSINFQGGGSRGSDDNAVIRVVAGTYGQNCGTSHGNKTSHLANACNNKTLCDYVVDYTVIGDPAVGCAKDYVAEWRCGNDSTVHRASAPPEAGYRKKVNLSCPR